MTKDEALKLWHSIPVTGSLAESLVKFAEAIAAPPATSERDAEDAARLDWLIQQGNCVVAEGNKGFWLKWINEYDSNKSEFQIGEYSTPRQAIDAQREQSEKRSGEGGK